MGGFSMAGPAKRDLADRLLAWLKEVGGIRYSIGGAVTWPNTYGMLMAAAADLDAEVFSLWKAFDLLIVMGRVVRNNPNGKKGGRVLDFSPLAVPLPPGFHLCEPDHCPVVQAVRRACLEIEKKGVHYGKGKG